jgi:hypothetical protein
MDVSDTAKLAVLMCVVDAKFNITDEMLGIQPI